MRLRRPLPAVQGDTLHIVGVGDNRIGKVRSTQSSDSSLDGSLIIWAIGVFTFGVLLSSIAIMTGYITQYKYFQEASGNVPVGGLKCWHIAALIFVILSILFFFTGVILSIVAFSF